MAKGRIPVGPSTTLARLLALGPFEEVLLNAAPHSYPEVSQRVRRVPDVVADCGPFGGLTSCLLAATTPWVIAVAVDQPFVDDELLQRLTSTGRAACFTTESGVEPLPCCVPRAWAEAWRGRLENAPSLRQVLEIHGVTTVPLRPDEASKVVSINTPADAERWLSLRNFPPLLTDG